VVTWHRILRGFHPLSLNIAGGVCGLGHLVSCRRTLHPRSRQVSTRLCVLQKTPLQSQSCLSRILANMLARHLSSKEQTPLKIGAGGKTFRQCATGRNLRNHLLILLGLRTPVTETQSRPRKPDLRMMGKSPPPGMRCLESCRPARRGE